MKLMVGVDLGGTSAKIALVDGRKKILKQANLPTENFPSPSKLASQLAQAILRLLGKHRGHRVGVGVAGDIDFQNGVVRVSPNLGWKNVPLRSLLERHLKMPVVIDNDANAAAWGVYHTQVPKNVKDVIIVTLGTGVGGGLIINGRLHRGATGSAGELGHMILDEKGPLCNCGQRGCLETYVGGPHLVRYVNKALRAGTKSTLQKIYKTDPLQITAKTIADAAQKKDRFALSVWTRVGHSLGLALGDLIYILNPEMIFLAGGVSQAEQLILKPLKETLKARPFQTPVKAVKIQIAKDPAFMGVIGASFL